MSLARACMTVGRLLLWALLAGAAPAHAVTVCSPGSGGTGIDPGTGGTGIGSGGTGIGTGGTGRVSADPGTGGTGIVGVITGFASVCVNGIEAEFDARTAIFDNGKPAGPMSLKVGQVVEVTAVGKGERVFAQSIHVNDVLVGPVTRVDAANRRLEVMHQPVRWDGAQVPHTPGATAPGDVRPGQYLRVSGFRGANGEVLASRIDAAPAGPVRLTGAITSASARGIEVQGVRVDRGQDDVATAGRTVRIEGQWQEGAITATRIEPATPAFAKHIDFVSVQGVLDTRDGEVRVGDTRVALDAQSAIEGEGGTGLRSGEFVQVEAAVSADGELRVEKLLRGTRLARPGRQSDDAADDDDGRDADVDEHDGDGSDDSDDGAARDDDGGNVRREDDGDDSGERESRRDEEHRDESGRDQDERAVRDDERELRDGRGDEQTRDRAHRDDTGGRDERSERVERDRPEQRIDKPERVDKPERSERVERVERAGRVDRIERVDRVERVDRIDRLERVDRVERVDKPERVERSGRDH